ncbi:hypothetical protein FB451DRAFT_1190423 [Mycena latifolia]|nr:hypothetical protein FB451DRAFT_1190423 [Mycena latifolia]
MYAGGVMEASYHRRRRQPGRWETEGKGRGLTWEYLSEEDIMASCTSDACLGGAGGGAGRGRKCGRREAAGGTGREGHVDRHCHDFHRSGAYPGLLGGFYSYTVTPPNRPSRDCVAAPLGDGTRPFNGREGNGWTRQRGTRYPSVDGSTGQPKIGSTNDAGTTEFCGV